MPTTLSNKPFVHYDFLPFVRFVCISTAYCEYNLCVEMLLYLLLVYSGQSYISSSKRTVHITTGILSADSWARLYNRSATLLRLGLG